MTSKPQNGSFLCIPPPYLMIGDIKIYRSIHIQNINIFLFESDPANLRGWLGAMNT